MQAKATTKIPVAIVADGASLRHLWTHVEEFAGQCSAVGMCSDGISREFESIDALLGYENTPPSRLMTLAISGTSKDYKKQVSVDLGQKYELPSEISLRGDEADLFKTRTKIVATMSGMRAWYSPIATVELYKVWALALMLGFFVLMFMASTKTQERPGLPLREAIRYAAAMLLGLAGAALVVWGVARLRSRLFPRVAFQIGQGASRYTVDEAIRWCVCVAFVVGLATSIVYGLIT